MDLRQLEALIAIDEHGSFSRAADALGTVQSNISSRIARLEGELGTELVSRSSGVLSESGSVVVHRARRVLGEMSAIVADVAELTADVRGPVSLGVIGTAGRWIVPLLLEAQRVAYPHIGLRTIASLTFDGHGPSILPATALSAHLADKFVAVHVEGLAKRRVSLVSRRFGFPSAPVRAINALLRETISDARVVPEGIYVPTRSTPL